MERLEPSQTNKGITMEIDESEFISISKTPSTMDPESSEFKPIDVFNRYIVVDNFYTQPEAMRLHALQMEKEDESGGNYAGVMTKDSFLTQEHLEAFKKLIGQDIYPSTSLTGKFRFTKESDEAKQCIHFDPGDNNASWAGVIYLSHNNEHEGTSFWRHNRTNLEAIPRTLEGIQLYGWNGPDDLKQFLDTEGMDESLWTKTLTIPFKYNRLILFRPWMFHSPGPAFGSDIETARLIQTFFFGTLDQSL